MKNAMKAFGRFLTFLVNFAITWLILACTAALVFNMYNYTNMFLALVTVATLAPWTMSLASIAVVGLTVLCTILGWNKVNKELGETVKER